MSTTMPSASSSRRRKVASTTNVAPCSAWAGPKVSPRKLWATIMWSRTVVLNTSALLARVVVRNHPAAEGCGVAEPVADGGQLPPDQAGQDVGRLREGGLAGDEDVEGRVGQQVEREREPFRPGAPVAPGGGDRADLAA